MDIYFVLDEQGDPSPVRNFEEWASWCERSDRGVARTIVSSNVVVLTIFSGLNEEVATGEPPLLFHTCVFGGVLDGEDVQHATRPAALAGHARLVEWCREGILPDAGITEDQLT